jgi:hypothetical protein
LMTEMLECLLSLSDSFFFEWLKESQIWEAQSGNDILSKEQIPLPWEGCDIMQYHGFQSNFRRGFLIFCFCNVFFSAWLFQLANGVIRYECLVI